MFSEKHESSIARQDTIPVIDPNPGQDHAMGHRSIPPRNESLLYIPAPNLGNGSPPCWKIQVISEPGELQAFSNNPDGTLQPCSQHPSLHPEPVGLMTKSHQTDALVQ